MITSKGATAEYEGYSPLSSSTDPISYKAKISPIYLDIPIPAACFNKASLSFISAVEEEDLKGLCDSFLCPPVLSTWISPSWQLLK